MLDRKKRPRELHVELPLPGAKLQVDQRFVHDHAGIVDQNVDAAQLFDHCVGQRATWPSAATSVGTELARPPAAAISATARGQPRR